MESIAIKLKKLEKKEHMTLRGKFSRMGKIWQQGVRLNLIKTHYMYA